MSRLLAENRLDLALNEPLTWFDYSIEWVLGAALVFSPLAFGTTNAWSQQTLYAAIGVLAILVGAKTVFVRGSKYVFTWAYLPILLYLAMVTLSVIPLPAGLVQAISPGTLENKTSLLSDIPNVKELLGKLTISYNVWNTNRSLRLILAMSVVFAVVVNTYRTPAQVKRLIATVAIAGTIVTLLALAQNLTHEAGDKFRIYWNLPGISVDAVHPNAGPFAGKAQLGQYLNLVIGAMLALALVHIGETFYGEDPTFGELFDRAGTAKLWTAGLLFVVVLLSIVAMAWCRSRGAMMSGAVSIVVAALLLIYKRGWRKRETIIALNSVLIVAVALGVTYVMLQSQIEKLVGTSGLATSVRAEIFKSSAVMFKTWPVMGSGLDSFEWVFPMFASPKLGTSFFDHGENDYMQTLSDTGVIGFALTMLFLTILLGHWAKAFIGRHPIHLATVGIAYSLLATMLHSFADFSQRTPAIALVTAVLLGLTVSLSRQGRPAMASESSSPKFGWSPWPRVVTALIVIVVMGWVVYSLNNVRRGEFYAWESDPTVFRLDIKSDDPDFDRKMDDYYDQPISDNEKAVQLDPQNLLHVRNLNHFRWRRLAAKRDMKTTAIIYPPNAKKIGEQIVTELSAARLQCPCYGSLHTLLGKIQWDLLGDKQEAIKNLDIARHLRPGDAEPIAYLCQAAADENRWEDARRWGEECFNLSPQFGTFLINLLVHEHQKPELAFEILKDNDEPLSNLLTALRSYPDKKKLVEQGNLRLLEFSKKVTEENPKSFGAWANYGGRLQESGDKAGAAEAFKQALSLEYGDVGLRFQRAQLLKSLGRKEEAAKEADICLRLRPQMDEARKLLVALSTPPPPPAD